MSDDERIYVQVAGVVKQRPDGWWVEFTFDRQRIPEHDAGPFDSKAAAEFALTDFREMLASTGALSLKGST